MAHQELAEDLYFVQDTPEQTKEKAKKLILLPENLKGLSPEEWIHAQTDLVTLDYVLQHDVMRLNWNLMFFTGDKRNPIVNLIDWLTQNLTQALALTYGFLKFESTVPQKKSWMRVQNADGRQVTMGLGCNLKTWRFGASILPHHTWKYVYVGKECMPAKGNQELVRYLLPIACMLRAYGYVCILSDIEYGLDSGAFPIVGKIAIQSFFSESIPV